MIRRICTFLFHLVTFFSLLSTLSQPSFAALFKNPDRVKKETTGKDREKTKERGGWGSSGGGGGIACFQTTRAAQQAEHLINKNQVLPKSLVDQIKEITTLDYWEWKQQKDRFSIADSNATNLEARIDEVYRRMSHLVPLFIFRLQQAGRVIDIKNWDEQQQVPRIYEEIPKGTLPKNCKHVQLVARYAQDAYDLGPGPAKKLPLIKVEVNRLLFDKLDLLNQAILILHEQMYLLGQLTGVKSSDLIRPLVMKFFSPLWSSISPISQEKAALKGQLIHVFGDYVNYFGDDLKFNATAFSQESRFNSFYEFINTVRSKIELCNDGKLPPEEMIPWRSDLQTHSCKDYVMNPNVISNWATDEMSYLYLANYLLDIAIRVINAEDVITPFADPIFIERSQMVVKASCEVIKINASKIKVGQLAIKATRYCEQAKDRLSPMEKDQN